MSGSLDGLVIADFTRVLAGPYATMLLADLGAEVIKVERPLLGDDTRSWGPPFDQQGRATYFEAVNRNKTSVAIDLRASEGQLQARDLISRADVVMHNFAPDVAARFGLDYDSVKAIRPDVVHCAITGFGSGVGATLPGYDLLVQAMGGLMSVTGPDDQHPMKVGVALVDVITGLHATVGVLAALRHRSETGVGQSIEVNLLSSLLSAMVNQSSAFVSGGEVPVAMGNAHPSIAPYEVYQAQDRQIVLAVGNDVQFVELCEVLGLSTIASVEKFSTNTARVTNRVELNRLINDRLSTNTCAYWCEQLNARHVPCGPINDISQAFALADSLGLHSIVDIELDGVTRHQVASPITMSHTPVEYRCPPPDLPSVLE